MAQVIKVYAVDVVNEPAGVWWRHWFATREEAEAALPGLAQENKLTPGDARYPMVEEHKVPTSKEQLLAWLNRYCDKSI